MLLTGGGPLNRGAANMLVGQETVSLKKVGGKNGGNSKQRGLGGPPLCAT